MSFAAPGLWPRFHLCLRRGLGSAGGVWFRGNTDPRLRLRSAPGSDIHGARHRSLTWGGAVGCFRSLALLQAMGEDKSGSKVRNFIQVLSDVIVEPNVSIDDRLRLLMVCIAAADGERPFVPMHTRPDARALLASRAWALSSRSGTRRLAGAISGAAYTYRCPHTQDAVSERKPTRSPAASARAALPTQQALKIRTSRASSSSPRSPWNGARQCASI